MQIFCIANKLNTFKLKRPLSSSSNNLSHIRLLIYPSDTYYETLWSIGKFNQENSGDIFLPLVLNTPHYYAWVCFVTILKQYLTDECKKQNLKKLLIAFLLRYTCCPQFMFRDRGGRQKPRCRSGKKGGQQNKIPSACSSPLSMTRSQTLSTYVPSINISQTQAKAKKVSQVNSFTNS